MKKIILVRHGKAERLSLEQDDYKRNLIERGVIDSTVMAEKLKRKKQQPEFWISSPANRAFQTAKIFASVFLVEAAAISMEPSIYEAEVIDVVKVINKIPNKYATIILFGHNPSFSSLTSYLTDSEEIELPTASYVVIEFNSSDWQQISANDGKIIDFEYPKALN